MIPVARIQAVLTLGIAATIAASGAPAQTGAPNPQRTIRLLVPAGAGGSTDLIARLTAGRLSEQLGVAVIAENRASSGGVVAALAVAQAAPDGYTLGMVYTPHTVNPSLNPKLPYDTLADFAPVALMTASPLVLAVPGASPYNTVAELIGGAKSRSLNYGSAGHGSGGHLSGELFKLLAGIPATHIPYKGAGPAAADLVAGTLDFQFASQITVQGFLRQGRVRALGITSGKRSASLPDVPTMIEAGLKEFEVLNWFGMVAPARTPPAIVARLNQEIALALAHPDVRRKLTTEGAEIIASTPEVFGAFIKTEISKWAKVVKAADMKAD